MPVEIECLDGARTGQVTRQREGGVPAGPDLHEAGAVDRLSGVAQMARHDRPVFDLAGEFAFEICGTGSDLDRLRLAISERSLDEVVTCHGYCQPEQIREIISRSHAVIAPTRKDFDAGFEMTCSEAILSGRPLITSAVCPALFYLQPASIEVEPENVGQYRSAIEQLRDNAALFQEKVEATGPLQRQFLIPETSWDVAIRRAFGALQFSRSR